jgi:oligoendopeptidase F
MGHAIHKYYSNNNQEYYYSDNAIFVAEIASTVNETLLNLYMLERSNNKKLIANEILEDIKNTVFRQTMFAEFELEVHNKSFNGESLSKDALNNIYFDLVKKYNGDCVVYDDYVKYEWSRIPHFYSPFYVYQYATGYSIAFAIANKIHSGDKAMLKKYIEFLKSGSNDYPTNLVNKMGIDIEESIDLTLNKFEELINTINK